MEWLKIVKNKKMILCFLLMLMVTTGIYLYAQVQKMQQEKFAYNLYEESVQKNILSYEERQRAYTKDYPQYIAQVLEQADTMSGVSIFQKKNSFSTRNLKKSKKAYRIMAPIQPQEGNYEALEHMISYDGLGYSIVIFGFVLIWYFLRDEKNGLKKIFYATPGGRSKLAAKRLGVMIGMISIYTISVYGFVGLAGGIVYGKSSLLNVCAQSMMLLKNYPYPVTVMEYLIIYLLLRILFAVSTVFFMWWLLCLFRVRMFGLMTLVFVYGIEAVLRFGIKDTSVMVFLKYINIVGMMCPGDILYEYRNFNFCNFPFNCLATTILLAVVVMFVSYGAILWLAERRRPVEASGKLEKILGDIVVDTRMSLHRKFANFSVKGFELYKLLLVNKGIVVILLWLLVIISQLDVTRVNFIGKSALLNDIYREYAGTDDGRLREYVKGQEMIIQEVTREYQEKQTLYENDKISEEAYISATQIYSSYESLIRAVDDLKKQFAYIDRVKRQYGRTVSVVFEKPYRILWTGNGFYEDEGYGNQEIRTIANLLLVIFLMSQIFSYDKMNHMEYVIRCCEGGRTKLFYLRMMISFVICVLVCGISYGLRIWEINRNYPLLTLKAPLQSLEFMERFPLKLSIGGFMILLFWIHVFTLFAVAVFVLWLTYHLSAVRGIIVAIGILVIPQIAYMLGLREAWFLSAIQPVLCVEILNMYGFFTSALVTILFLLGGGVCAWKLHREWCGPMERKKI